MPRDIDEKYIPQRCDLNDPNRCKADASEGQCTFLAVPGEEYCSIHCRSQNLDIEKKNLYDFQLTQVGHRIKEFKNHPDSKKLTTELGLIRLLLEQTVNQCEKSYDLVVKVPEIMALVEKIRIVQQANIGIEQKLGDLLSIEQVTEISQLLYDVVTKHIKKHMKDAALDVLEEIAIEFEQALEKKF